MEKHRILFNTSILYNASAVANACRYDLIIKLLILFYSVHMLQDVLFRHYCQHLPINQYREMRKYKNRIKKQSKAETHDLPVYILEKFRDEKLSPVKDLSNKLSLQKDYTQSQIFMHRNKINKCRQSLSPLRNKQNLREYSNLLFPKKIHE